MKKSYTTFFSIAVLLFVGSCYKKQQGQNKKIECDDFLDASQPATCDHFQKAINPVRTVGRHHVMVVFVHGTLVLIPSPASFGSALYNFFSKSRRLNKSFYQFYFKNLRSKTFYRHQAIGPLGLQAVNVDTPYTGPFEAARVIAKTYREMHRVSYAQDSSLLFYTFGWEGRLNQKGRQDWGKIFSNQLSSEVARVKQSLSPKDSFELVVIGHSHGGNVALNLAASDYQDHDNVLVDRLVLLGTPIQRTTAHYINSPRFKNVYNIYSNSDKIQTLDVFTTKDRISRRRVEKDFLQGQELPNKLKQISIRIGKHEPSHVELAMMRAQGNIFYRRSLLINPLPFISFIPVVFSLSDRSTEKKIDGEINFVKRGFCIDAIISTTVQDNSVVHQDRITFDISKIRGDPSSQ